MWIPLWLHSKQVCQQFRLFYTDTNSLMYKIRTENVYEDFGSDKELFDFSSHWNKS